jgi:hypothetical protein
MNTGASEGSWAIRLSIQLYRRLLVAYPNAFRREYGAHMAQVFGDCCREAAQVEGVVGLWRYWLMAFGDLIGSALAERRRQEFGMSRTVWVRLGSLAAIVGGTTAALFAVFGSVMAEAQALDPASPLARNIFPFQVILWEATSVVSALYLLALIGLSLQGASRAGALGWIGIATGVIGTVLSALGAWVLSSLVYPQRVTCMSLLDCRMDNSKYYDTFGAGGQVFGMMLFAVGMTLYGIAALRYQVLPRWNGAPALLGLLALLVVAVFFFDVLARPGADLVWSLQHVLVDAGPLRLNLVEGVVPLLLAAAWIALGVALFPRKGERTAPQAIPANGSAG